MKLGFAHRGKRTEKPRVTGALTSFNHDGLVLAERRRRRSEIDLPWKAFIQVALIVTAVKLLLYIDLGPIAYNARVETLSQGAWYEQIGAWLMFIDPFSQMVLDTITGWTR